MLSSLFFIAFNNTEESHLSEDENHRKYNFIKNMNSIENLFTNEKFLSFQNTLSDTISHLDNHIEYQLNSIYNKMHEVTNFIIEPMKLTMSILEYKILNLMNVYGIENSEKENFNHIGSLNNKYFAYSNNNKDNLNKISPIKSNDKISERAINDDIKIYGYDDSNVKNENFRVKSHKIITLLVNNKALNFQTTESEDGGNEAKQQEQYSQDKGRSDAESKGGANTKETKAEPQGSKTSDAQSKTTGTSDNIDITQDRSNTLEIKKESSGQQQETKSPNNNPTNNPTGLGQTKGLNSGNGQSGSNSDTVGNSKGPTGESNTDGSGVDSLIEEQKEQHTSGTTQGAADTPGTDQKGSGKEISNNGQPRTDGQTTGSTEQKQDDPVSKTPPAPGPSDTGGVFDFANLFSKGLNLLSQDENNEFSVTQSDVTWDDLDVQIKDLNANNHGSDSGTNDKKPQDKTHSSNLRPPNTNNNNALNKHTHSRPKRIINRNLPQNRENAIIPTYLRHRRPVVSKFRVEIDKLISDLDIGSIISPIALMIISLFGAIWITKNYLDKSPAMSYTSSPPPQKVKTSSAKTNLLKKVEIIIDEEIVYETRIDKIYINAYAF